MATLTAASMTPFSRAFMVVSSKNSQSTVALEAYDTAVKSVTTAQGDLYVALMKSRGAATEDVFAAQTKTIEALQDKLTATSQTTGSFSIPVSALPRIRMRTWP